MVAGAASLRTHLQELAALADPVDVIRLDQLGQRLRDQRLRILVVGEAKRGKSTLVNALLGRPILPTGVTPLTALPVTVRNGAAEQLTVTYTDGRTEVRPAADLAILATEGGNPDNRLAVADLVVDTPAGLLADGAEVVDTPGVGSVHHHSAAATGEAMDTMDAAVFVLSVDPPISDSERELLHRIRGRSVALFCVLNKVDRLDPADLDEVIAFTSAVLTAATGRPTPVYPCAAREALTPPTHDTGVAILRRDLADYLRTRRDQDLSRSVAGHATRIADRLADQARLTHRAINLAKEDAYAQVDKFAAQLAAADAGRHDAIDVGAAAVARSLAELNHAAERDAPRLADQIRATVNTTIADTPPMPTAALEDRVRQAAIAAITTAADTWRNTQHRRITEALASIDHRLVSELDASIRQVRDAAAELLGLQLTIPAPAESLLPDIAVRYALDDDIGVTVAWEAAIRRHLPARWGRRAVRRHLNAQAGDLTERQIGRIRSALQQALRPAQAALTAAIDTRYATVIGGLHAALDTAAAIAESTTQTDAIADLEARIATLERLRDALDADAAAASDTADRCSDLPPQVADR